MIPEFPLSRSIEISDKKAFDEHFAGMNPKTSESTFTNFFLWGQARGYRMTRLGDQILVFLEEKGKKRFFSPIGPKPAEAIEDVMNKEKDAVFERVPEEVAGALSDPGLEVAEDRDNFDYVYRREDLVRLEGARYYPKRSFAGKARENYSPRILEGGEISVEGCRRLQDEWCEQRMCERDKSLMEESKALYALFLKKKDLWVTCVAVEIGGRIAAFAAGEPLNDDTFVVHFEKADGKYRGIYQLMNNEFAKRIPDKFRFVNREQDLGIEGLRKAKESYYPDHMVKKFKVMRKPA